MILNRIIFGRRALSRMIFGRGAFRRVSFGRISRRHLAERNATKIRFRRETLGR
jgi:hypothetical protein